jgi:hypothetical protein
LGHGIQKAKLGIPKTAWSNKARVYQEAKLWSQELSRRPGQDMKVMNGIRQ